MESSERRRARIVELVRSHDFVRVADLGEMFGVSPVTVRGDLDVLAARGEIRRIRGGAISQDAPPGPAEDEDDGIGRAAASLLEDGDCAFVGAGALGLARALARNPVRDAVVVTNGLDVADTLAGAGYKVIVTGGTVAGSALLDPLGELVMARVNADVAFVPCAAVAAGGATDPDLRLAAAARRMLDGAARRVVLVPGLGVGRVRTGVVCPADDIDVVVTGRGADSGAVTALREQGIEVVVA
jgi:DeoR family transcriptional regulator of aga operon